MLGSGPRYSQYGARALEAFVRFVVTFQQRNIMRTVIARLKCGQHMFDHQRLGVAASEARPPSTADLPTDSLAT